MSHSAITVNQAAVTYRNSYTILRDITSWVPDGSIAILVGVSDSGKSTLFRTLVDFVRLTQGEISILQQPMNRALKQNLIAYVPQSEEVDQPLPVLVGDAVMMGRFGHMSWLRRLKQIGHAYVGATLARVDMLGYRHRQMGELFSGQKKYVLLTRATMQDRQVILLDEPFVGVDVEAEARIIDLLHELHGEGQTMPVFAHNLRSVIEFCDRAVMTKGTALASGLIETTLTSEDLELAFSGVLHHVALSSGGQHVVTSGERPFTSRHMADEGG